MQLPQTESWWSWCCAGDFLHHQTSLQDNFLKKSFLVALTQLRDLDPTLGLIIIFIAETIFQGIAPPRPAAAFSFIFLSQDVQCTNSKILPATRRSSDANVSHLLQKIDEWKQCLLMLVTILLILCHNYQLHWSMGTTWSARTHPTLAPSSQVQGPVWRSVPSKCLMLQEDENQTLQSML